jgi:hypothetical protein
MSLHLLSNRRRNEKELRSNVPQLTSGRRREEERSRGGTVHLVFTNWRKEKELRSEILIDTSRRRKKEQFRRNITAGEGEKRN